MTLPQELQERIEEMASDAAIRYRTSYEFLGSVIENQLTILATELVKERDQLQKDLREAVLCLGVCDLATSELRRKLKERHPELFKEEKPL